MDLLERDLSKSVIVKTVTQPNMQYIINGQPVNVEFIAICCPNCEKIIFNSQSNNIIDVYNMITNSYEQLSNDIHYCVNCGQKIHFTKIIDVKSQE